MNNNPLIFLFTCVYNDKKHINRLFDSIANQTVSNFVYYLYDDASDKDCYDDLYKDLKEKLNKRGIKAYYEKGKKNLGINKATEHCLIKLRDEFKDCTHFAWINSDDWLEPFYINEMTHILSSKHSYELVIPNFNRYKETNNDLKKIKDFYPKNQFKISKNYIVDNIYRCQIYSHFVMNKNSFLKINPKCCIFDNSVDKWFFNDVCLMFLSSLFCFKTKYLNKKLSNFLFRNNALSIETDAPKNKTFAFLRVQYLYLKSINPNIIEKYSRIIRVVLTHYVCIKLLENKKIKELKFYFKINKKMKLKLNLPYYYLCPNRSSFFLFYLPRIYRFIHKIKIKILK